MRLLVLRPGGEGEIEIDAQREGISTFAQLQEFLRRLFDDPRPAQLFTNGGRVSDFHAAVGGERVVCYFPAPADAGITAGAVTINHLQNFFQGCSFGAQAPSGCTASPQAGKVVSVPRAEVAPSSRAAPLEATKIVSVPRVEVPPASVARKSPAAPAAQPFKRAKLPAKQRPVAAAEEALLLTSGSEEGEAAAVRPRPAPVVGPDGRVDISRLEQSSLPELRRELQGKTVVYRAIVEEEGCPVISAEKTATVQGVPSAKVLQLLLHDGETSQQVRLDTVYSLNVAPGAAPPPQGCPAAGCVAIHHALYKQVNYYFSPKNYAKDDFIQVHVAKNEGKGMPFALLNNFPRIRNSGVPLPKLREILEAHLACVNVNYALNDGLIGARLLA